jgi:hypothetical protein
MAAGNSSVDSTMRGGIEAQCRRSRSKSLAHAILSIVAMFQQMTPSRAFCVTLDRRRIMEFATRWLYLAVLIVYAGLVTWGSEWPEKPGGGLLTIKQKPPPASQPSHSMYASFG